MANRHDELIRQILGKSLDRGHSRLPACCPAHGPTALEQCAAELAAPTAAPDDQGTGHPSRP